MSKIEDGGPAFPSERNPIEGEGAFMIRLPGMSLRDWFAGQAPEPSATWWGGSAPDCAGYAQWNYQYADAMLAARAKEPGA